MLYSSVLLLLLLLLLITCASLFLCIDGIVIINEYHHSQKLFRYYYHSNFRTQHHAKSTTRTTGTTTRTTTTTTTTIRSTLIEKSFVVSCCRRYTTNYYKSKRYKQHHDVAIENIEDAVVVEDFSSSYKRRQLLCAMIATVPLLTCTSDADAVVVAETGKDDERTIRTLITSTPSSVIHVPIYYISRLASYVVYYSINGDQFAAVVDTGSPFLTIPSIPCWTRSNIDTDCSWGCYSDSGYKDSGLKDTMERFANSEGLVRWRQGSFAFVCDKNNTNYTNAVVATTLFQSNLITFGVLSESLMDGPGGVFFGLVRDTDKWIRPSFLSQTNVKSFQIDLRNTTKSGTLTLSTDEQWKFIDKGNQYRNYISLVKDLNRKYGDPVIHYVAIANSIIVNGTPLPLSTKKKLYVIFDTGVTGMVLSEDLWKIGYETSRMNRQRTLWKTVEITFHDKSRTTYDDDDIDINNQKATSISLKASKPITTPLLGGPPWPKFKNAYLIVAGLAFFEGHRLTFEIDGRRLWID